MGLDLAGRLRPVAPVGSVVAGCGRDVFGRWRQRRRVAAAAAAAAGCGRRAAVRYAPISRSSVTTRLVRGGVGVPK